MFSLNVWYAPPTHLFPHKITIPYYIIRGVPPPGMFSLTVRYVPPTHLFLLLGLHVHLGHHLGHLALLHGRVDVQHALVADSEDGVMVQQLHNHDLRQGTAGQGFQSARAPGPRDEGQGCRAPGPHDEGQGYRAPGPRDEGQGYRAPGSAFLGGHALPILINQMQRSRTHIKEPDPHQGAGPTSRSQTHTLAALKMLHVLSWRFSPVYSFCATAAAASKAGQAGGPALSTAWAVPPRPTAVEAAGHPLAVRFLYLLTLLSSQSSKVAPLQRREG